MDIPLSRKDSNDKKGGGPLLPMTYAGCVRCDLPLF
jgi:hypothetical protein